MPATDKFILGTVQFGLAYGINNSTGIPAKGSVTRIFDMAYDSGIRTLDTAEAYGSSQSVIGDYHKDSRRKFDVITKFSTSFQPAAGGSLRDRIKEDIALLGTESLHGYMFHSFSDFERFFELYREEISVLKEQRLIKKFGVSVYTNSELERLLTMTNAVDFVQLPFNLLDNNLQRRSIIQKVRANGVEIHTRSVFLQGLFFMETQKLPGKLKPLSPYLDKLHALSRESGIEMDALALQYVLRQPDISRVLIGVDSPEHLERNLDALQQDVPAECFAEIDSIRVADPQLLNPSTWNA